MEHSIYVFHVIFTDDDVGLNIFYSKEKDWVCHKTRHYPLQGELSQTDDDADASQPFLIDQN